MRRTYNIFVLLLCVANSPDALIFKCGTKRGRNALKTLGGAGKNAAKCAHPLKRALPPHTASGLNEADSTPRENALAPADRRLQAIARRERLGNGAENHGKREKWTRKWPPAGPRRRKGNRPSELRITRTRPPENPAGARHCANDVAPAAVSTDFSLLVGSRSSPGAAAAPVATPA